MFVAKMIGDLFKAFKIISLSWFLRNVLSCDNN